MLFSQVLHVSTVLLMTHLLCETGCVVEAPPSRLEPILPDDAKDEEVQQARWIDRLWEEHTVSYLLSCLRNEAYADFRVFWCLHYTLKM